MNMDTLLYINEALVSQWLLIAAGIVVTLCVRYHTEERIREAFEMTKSPKGREETCKGIWEFKTHKIYDRFYMLLKVGLYIEYGMVSAIAATTFAPYFEKWGEPGLTMTFLEVLLPLLAIDGILSDIYIRHRIEKICQA